MNYLHFDFETDTLEQQERLVALLSSQGFEGFEEEDNNLNAYIPEQLFDEDGFSQVIDLFETVSYTKTVIENINWNKKWEQDFKPVVVDDFAAIRAGFHQPIAGVAHDIIITPKMSFGTGHHATTYLVIRQMKEIDFNGKTVLDFGTGTGVLAILADKLGAKNVLAIDYDEWSITNANENIIRNNCANIDVEQLDTVPADKQFDIILANINLNVITANLPEIVKASVPGATIVLSGFLKENEPVLINSLKEAGLENFSIAQRGDWIMITANSPLSGK